MDRVGIDREGEVGPETALDSGCRNTEEEVDERE
jgi:hypothetical protein